MRMHRHRNANCAEDHCDQADQAENRGRIIQALAQRRIPFLEIHYLRVRQNRFNLFTYGRIVRSGRQFQKHALRGAAARGEQTCALQRCA